MKKTVEKQYNQLFQVKEKYGRSQFGLMSNQVWNEDPKRIIFTLARYKFVSKMLNSTDRVLEIGCADAFGTRIVKQAVKKIDVSDFDQVFLDDSKLINKNKWNFNCYYHDFVKDGPFKKKNYDAIYSLDVLEHIKPNQEKKFIININKSLSKKGVAIYGIPSLESQKYASYQSKIGHVNCQSGDDFKKSLSKFYEKVFLFSMNDEVVHTGFYPMAHYLLALCCYKK